MEREVCCICEGETLHYLHDVARPLHSQPISRILAGQPITSDERSGINNHKMLQVYEKSQRTFEGHVHPISRKW